VNGDFSFPLRVTADRYPDGLAFICKEESWTFRDFDAATDRLAASFEARGVAGERVILLLQNEPKTVMVYLALARAGAISVPVNPRLLLDEISFIVQDSGASAVIADAVSATEARELMDRHAELDRLLTVNAESDGGGGERLEDVLEAGVGASRAAVDPASVAMIVYTSGTSGFPKGVMRTHQANIWACVNATLGQPRFPEDVEVFVLPLFAIAFIFQVMPMILSGGTTILDGSFDPVRTWEQLDRHRATRVFLAPTMLDSMLSVDGHEGYDVSTLRILNTAYEFPERVRMRAAERFGDILAYMYGLTEAQLCCSTPGDFAEDPSNAGHPMGMMRVRVVDEHRIPVDVGTVGEIAMAGPSLMSGYHGRPEITAEVLADGWLYTGDLGYLDEAGRVHVCGRLKEMIKTGGFSVDPVEVEKAILAFPGVREAAVVGIPDDHWGEVVVAAVSASATIELSEPQLRSFVKSRVAGYKCPKRVLFMSELPKNAMGKIERGRLRTQAAEMPAPARGAK
jgi:acyl-CoA synthetase (AMP-forming)/AMP-acid ligase II